MGKRILVTGGAGYIGSHTVKLLRERGQDVWVIDNLVFGHRRAVPGERLITADLLDLPVVERVLREQRIEAIVHFAAFAFVGESVREPAKYWRNNFVATLGLLDLCRKLEIRNFVFSSTCATYGIPTTVPITEDHPQAPINPYGESKLAVEKALADYARAYGLGYAALRYFNAAGAAADGSIGEDHDPETHLIPLILQTVMGQRSHIEIYGTDYPTPDGTCIRDYIHVDDLAEAHWRALQAVEPGQGICCNLGTGQGYSIREVIRAAEDVTGQRVPVREGARRPGDPPELVASARLARETLGWVPRYRELRPILETAWNWHQKHPHGYNDRKSGDRAT